MPVDNGSTRNKFSEPKKSLKILSTHGTLRVGRIEEYALHSL